MMAVAYLAHKHDITYWCAFGTGVVETLRYAESNNKSQAALVVIVCGRFAHQVDDLVEAHSLALD
jgi:hypothetical protein